MWPRRYFAGRYFAPRYFPESQGVTPDAPTEVPLFWVRDLRRPNRRRFL